MSPDVAAFGRDAGGATTCYRTYAGRNVQYRAMHVTAGLCFDLDAGRVPQRYTWTSEVTLVFQRQGQGMPSVLEADWHRCRRAPIPNILKLTSAS